MSLTSQQRAALRADDFAVPAKRDLPIHDKVHVRMAWQTVDKVKGLSDDERAIARRNILAQANKLGVDTKDWHLQVVSFAAMALEFPDDTEHANKLPFEGVLTLLDVPSDSPLFGTGGKRVILPSAVAEAALGSLLGMAIDFTPEFDGHSPRNKIGLITAADVDAGEIRIKGYFYANDFPAEVQRIQAEKEDLGFSFEARSLMQSMKADPLVVSAIEFTGAAVLYKNAAAYQRTSISANADGDDMTPAQEAALNAATTAIAAMPTTIAQAVTLAMKAAADEKTRLDTEKAAADKKAADDAAALIAAKGTPAEMATLVANAVTTALTATMKPVIDGLSALGTQMKDIGTVVSASAEKEPQRKTLAPTTLALLEKIGLSASGDGKTQLKVSEVDAAAKKAGLDGVSSMALKIALKDAGHMATA